ncbi:hypothetical protein FOA52_009080 [Chlamydomonas sp. UWO 241]|nr:hypothetical protein FOA52_009080 [Chlamydomonas sp. UWO 241]
MGGAAGGSAAPVFSRTLASSAASSSSAGAASGQHPVLQNSAAVAAAAAANAGLDADSELGDNFLRFGGGSAFRVGQAANESREELKRQLSWATLGLGSVARIVPGGEPVRAELDTLVARLEEVSPMPLTPAAAILANSFGEVSGGVGGYGDGSDGYLSDLLQEEIQAQQVQAAMLGGWTLAYASSVLMSAPAPLPELSGGAASGNLFAQVLQLADTLPGLGMDAIEQALSLHPTRPGALTMRNSAVFRFGPLGAWRVAAAGTWNAAPGGGGGTAQATFESFSIAPVEFLGLSLEGMPEVTVPVPLPLQSVSTWRTTYLDADTRVARGEGGTLFLFRRPGAHSPARGSISGDGHSLGGYPQQAPSPQGIGSVVGVGVGGQSAGYPPLGAPAGAGVGGGARPARAPATLSPALFWGSPPSEAQAADARPAAQRSSSSEWSGVGGVPPAPPPPVRRW